VARVCTLVATRAPPREKRPDKKIYVREIGRSRRRGHVRNIVIVIIIYTYIGDLYEITRRGRTGRDKIYIVCTVGAVAMSSVGRVPVRARRSVAGLYIF